MSRFAGIKASHITTSLLEEYIEERQDQGVSNATINRELAALKAILNLGARQTPPKVDRNSIPYIPMLKESDPRSGFFEHGDFLAFRNALPDYLKGYVTFAYKTGWRRGEIANLDWNHVDLKEGTAWIDPGKTKNDSGKMIYLDAELREILDHQWKQRKKAGILTQYVFPNRSATGKIKNHYWHINKACKELGLDKLFHDFRRTAIRNMVRARIPDGVAMQVSGHKTRRVFERYNIVSDTDLRLAAQKQEDYLNGQTATIPLQSGKVKKLPADKQG